MTIPFLLSRALLQFKDDDDDLLQELSAITRTPDGHLWVGSDEFITIERLTPMGDGIYGGHGGHKTFHLKDYIDLFDHKSEAEVADARALLCCYLTLSVLSPSVGD